MKVEKSSSSSYASAASSYGKSKPVGEVRASSDSIEVSPSAGLFQKALVAAEQAPDVRTEAISGIQREFSAGSYQRDEHQVAEKVISDYLNFP